MPDPTTVNILLAVPTRGSNVGVWDTPVNGDFSSLDGHLGGVQSISLTNVNVTLSKPTGTATPGAGPTQAENAVIKLTGTLTGNVILTFPLPGEYIVRNNCTVGAFYVQARALGTGNMVGVPDGRPVKLWNDGTDVDFCDQPEVGSALDLHINTTTLPAWMTACSVLPYLVKNGAVHTASLYPVLASRLGSTYGGNGSTTFGVPDENARFRLPVDTSGVSGRVTAAISGINGTTFGSAGGSQSLQAHTHTATVNDPGHLHATLYNTNGFTLGGPGAMTIIGSGPGSGNSNSATTGITVANATTGSGASSNMPPAIVSFLPLIKT